MNEDRNLFGCMTDKIKETDDCWEAESDYKEKYENLVKKIKIKTSISCGKKGYANTTIYSSEIVLDGLVEEQIKEIILEKERINARD